MYYHVWPAVREGVERVLQKSTVADRVGGNVLQYLTLDGHGPYVLIIFVDNSAVVYSSFAHVYDAATGDANPKEQL
jgi:hypothetical protein